MRDVVDLLLLRNLLATTGSPSVIEVRETAIAVFEARAGEAMRLGRLARTWPPTIQAYEHWQDDYARAAASAGIGMTLSEAVAEANAWTTKIAEA